MALVGIQNLCIACLCKWLDDMSISVKKRELKLTDIGSIHVAKEVD